MKYSTRLAALSAILAACGVFQTTSFATSYNLNALGNWNNPSTWSPSGVPGASDDVTMAYAPADVVTVNDAENVLSLRMIDTNLNITSTGSLTGFTSVYYLVLDTYSTLNLSGTLDQTSSGGFGIGSTGGSTSSVIQTGSTSSLTTVSVFRPNNGSTTVSAYSISAGSAHFNGGIQDDNGLMTQTGGTVTVAGGQFANGNYATAIYKISGGTLNLSGDNNWIGEAGTGILKVIGHTATVNITTTTSSSFVLTQGAGQGELAFQVDNGGGSPAQIIDHGGATINANSLLDMSWVDGTGATAGAIYKLFEAPTGDYSFPGVGGSLANNLHLASNPEDADFQILPLDTTSVPGESILEAELLVSIPEPATLGIFAIGATALLARRRTK